MLEVRKAGLSDKEELRALLKTYLAEMFALQSLSTERINELGPYPYFDLYWEEESRFPYLISSESIAVGFALVRCAEENEIAEFYVDPSKRKSGIGRYAVTDLCKRHAGNWSVGVMKENQPATEFWRTVISEITNGNFSQEWSESKPNGPKFVFSV